MKVNVEFDCTPEEARRFLGLPDVSKANEAYAEATAKADEGRGQSSSSCRNSPSSSRRWAKWD